MSARTTGFVFAAAAALLLSDVRADSSVRVLNDKPGAKGAGNEDKLAPLVRDIKSRNPKVQLAAIARFRQLGREANDIAFLVVEHGMMRSNRNVCDAAGEAIRALDPDVYRELTTLLHDADLSKRLAAVDKLGDMGSDAKAALPAVLQLHAEFMSKSLNNQGGSTSPIASVNRQILTTLAAIAPENESVHKVVLHCVAAPDHIQPISQDAPRFRGLHPYDRMFVVDLMNGLPIRTKDKLSALATGSTVTRIQSDADAMVGQISELDIDRAEKCKALVRVVQSGSPAMIKAIECLSDLGADAKPAVPLLKRLKTHPNEAVRNAATSAVDAIRE